MLICFVKDNKAYYFHPSVIFTANPSASFAEQDVPVCSWIKKNMNQNRMSCIMNCQSSCKGLCKSGTIKHLNLFMGY